MSECCCRSFGDQLRASIERVELELCPVHDAEEIARRDAQRQVDEAEQRIDRSREIEAGIRALHDPPAECSCLSLAQHLGVTLAGEEIPPCAAHQPAASSQPPSIALNDDAGLANLIVGAFGGASVTFNSTGGGPLDAA